MPEQLQRIRLSPCPFCSGPAHCSNEGVWSVFCEHCGAEISAETNTEAAVVNAWNARAPAWQRIETAPKDRTLVIVALIKDGKVWRVSEAAFNGLGWYDVGGKACHWRTHWMPLPEPPEVEAMPRLDFICDKCGVQQHAGGICANCGSGNLCAQPSDVKGMPAS